MSIEGPKPTTPETRQIVDPITQEVGDLKAEISKNKEAKLKYSLKDYVIGEIEKGKTVEIDFKDQIEAEYNVGLADLMPKNVRKVKIQGERFGRTIEMEGNRKGINGGFFDEKTNQYMPVFNGFKVTIVDYATDEEITIIEKKNQEKANQLKENNPKVKQFIEKYGPEQTDKIISKAQDYGIDPLLLMALRRTENGGPGKEFGIMRDGANDFDSQLILACRTIQNNMSRFQNLSKENAINEDGSISLRFIAFLSNIYAPIGASNDPNNLNENHLRNFVKIYGEFYGKTYGNDTILGLYHGTRELREKVYNGTEVTGKTTPDNLIKIAQHYLGMRYQLGGNGNGSIDCSGLVVQAMKETGIVNFNYDNSAQGLYNLVSPKDPSTVQKGDLVFLQESDGRISHVEIAQGPTTTNGIPIIHASSHKGAVTESFQKYPNSGSKKVLVGTPKFYN